MILGENWRKSWRWVVIGKFQDWWGWIDLRAPCVPLLGVFPSSLLFSSLLFSSLLHFSFSFSLFLFLFLSLSLFFSHLRVVRVGEYGQGWIEVKENWTLLTQLSLPSCVSGKLAIPAPNWSFSPPICPCHNPQNLWMLYYRGFANLIQLRVSRWEDYPGLFGWAQCKHQDFVREMQEESEVDRRQYEDRSRDLKMLCC